MRIDRRETTRGDSTARPRRMIAPQVPKTAIPGGRSLRTCPIVLSVGLHLARNNASTGTGEASTAASKSAAPTSRTAPAWAGRHRNAFRTRAASCRLRTTGACGMTTDWRFHRGYLLQLSPRGVEWG
jgi:hypothetical protein